MTRLTMLAVVPLLALGLTACGPGDASNDVATAGGKANTPASTGPSGDPRELDRKFAKCMRDNGINMADPGAAGDGPVIAEGKPGKPGGGVVATKDLAAAGDGKFKAAMDKCRQYMPTNTEPPKQDPKDLEKLRAMAKCMREHGIDIPDPAPDGGAIQLKDGAKAIDPGSAKFKAADKACSHLGPQKSNGGAGPIQLGGTGQ